MKKLIEAQDIIKAAKLNKFGGGSTARILMLLLKINKINKIYSDISNYSGTEFIDHLIKELKINYKFNEEELSRIPKSGPFIIVANHPYGGIDGMLLVKIVAQVRDDYKTMANFLLQQLEPVKDYILPVNPFEDRKDAKSSLAGIKSSL